MKETLLAVAKTINSAHTAVKTTAASSFDSFLGSMTEPSLEFLFRGLRVVAVVFAIVSICTLLVGSFKYMVASGRDEEVLKCRYRIIVGGVGATVTIFLYYFASLVLVKIVGGG